MSLRINKEESGEAGVKIFIIVGMPAAGKHLARTDNYILNTGSMADAMASLNAIAKRW